MRRGIVCICMCAALLGGCGGRERQGQLPVAPAGVVRDAVPMVLVPTGPFLRGAKPPLPGEEWSNAVPVRTIYLDAFFIDKHEVTNAAYARFLRFADRPAPKWSPDVARGGADWSRFSWAGRQPPPGTKDLPVTLVSWFDAEAYCAWMGKRLPTEAEWEKAARGTDGRVYPWGNDPSGEGNFAKRHQGPLPVGSFPAGASPYGALDMAGNVAEWVADYYDPLYYGRSPVRNPKGPERGAERVVRGAYWDQPAKDARADRRWHGVPTWLHGGIGFRCARSAGGAR